MNLTKEEEKFLLDIARRAIEYYFKTKNILEIKPQELPSEKMIQEKATFVTLYIKNVIRGCMGSIEPKRPLSLDVVHNALKAAFADQKFIELKKDELPKIKITISILDNIVKLKAKNSKQILEKILPKVHGVIIRNGYQTSTYLPAVWNELKKEQFLSELSEKVGLGKDGWKAEGVEIYTYETYEFSEE